MLDQKNKQFRISRNFQTVVLDWPGNETELSAQEIDQSWKRLLNFQRIRIRKMLIKSVGVFSVR